MSGTEWHKRGEKWRARSLDALKELYSTKPGHEPKGIQTKIKPVEQMGDEAAHPPQEREIV